MVENDSVLYYIFYGIILIAFYVVLKMPKKDDNKSNKSNESKNDESKKDNEEMSKK